jgi:hypothetical protein
MNGQLQRGQSEESERVAHTYDLAHDPKGLRGPAARTARRRPRLHVSLTAQGNLL